MDLTASEQSVGSLIFFLLLLTFVTWIAYRNGFFRLPPPSIRPPVTWYHLIGGFLAYFIVAAVAVPILLSLTAYLTTGSLKGIDFLSNTWKGWAQLGGLCLLFLILVGYHFLLPKKTQHFILWGDKEASQKRLFKSIWAGFVGWVVSYPYVLVSSVVTSAIAKWIWGYSHLEQVAVKQLKMTMNNTPLFLAMIFVVAILVPFMEEYLFRGLLQNVLKRHFGRVWAIILTAIIFAMVHFAPSQGGTGNFQLVLSLLALAGFLGFVYERERTLWASITLHATFNTINILVITFVGD